MVVVVVLQFILRVGVFCPIWCVNFYPESRERESVCVRACVYVFLFTFTIFVLLVFNVHFCTDLCDALLISIIAKLFRNRHFKKQI